MGKIKTIVTELEDKGLIEWSSKHNTWCEKGDLTKPISLVRAVELLSTGDPTLPKKATK